MRPISRLLAAVFVLAAAAAPSHAAAPEVEELATGRHVKATQGQGAQALGVPALAADGPRPQKAEVLRRAQDLVEHVRHEARSSRGGRPPGAAAPPPRTSS